MSAMIPGWMLDAAVHIDTRMKHAPQHARVLAVLDFAERNHLGDREHVVDVPTSDARVLREWLTLPNGALHTGRVVFEAGGAGVLVRTRPYSVGS